MKILQVLSYFYPAYYYGGPGKLVHDLSLELIRLKHKVAVYTTDAFSTVRRQEKDNEGINKDIVKHFFKNISNFLAYRYKFFLPIGFLPFVISDIKNYDVIHIHEFFTPMAVIAAHYATLRKIPYVLSAHGTLDRYHFSHRMQVKKIFMRIFGRTLIRNSSGFIAATGEEILEYQSWRVPADKIHLIPNGIETSGFKTLPARGAFRRKNRIKDDAKILLYLGRIHKLKGLELLIEAFGKIKESNCFLVIAGSDDGYLSHLKSKITDDTAEKIIFTGLIEGREKMELYTDSDVFVYPSPREGFSIAILEAAACGLPLVITKGCKFPQVSQAKAGFVVPANKDALFSAMHQLLINEKFRRIAGTNAQKLIQNNFTIRSMATRLMTLYRNFSKVHG